MKQKTTYFLSFLFILTLISVFQFNQEGVSATNQESFFLPKGDAVAGRKAFKALQCYACHKVKGEDFPDPVIKPPLKMVFDKELAKKSRDNLAESIIAPSHQVAKGLKQAGQTGDSRMGSYREIMTVQQLVDIVEYLKSLQPKPK